MSLRPQHIFATEPSLAPLRKRREMPRRVSVDSPPDLVEVFRMQINACIVHVHENVYILSFASLSVLFY